MRKYLLTAAIALMTCLAFAFTSSEHLTGYIDDSMCAASAKPVCTPATRAACAAKCIKNGSKAVLVSGGKVYQIANQKSVMKFLGKNVAVDGNVTGSSIEITNVTETK